MKYNYNQISTNLESWLEFLQNYGNGVTVCANHLIGSLINLGPGANHLDRQGLASSLIGGAEPAGWVWPGNALVDNWSTKFAANLAHVIVAALDRPSGPRFATIGGLLYFPTAQS